MGVAKLIMLSEYVASSVAVSCAIWIRPLLLDLGIIGALKNPIILNVNNMFATFLIKNQEIHQKSKHIIRKYHFIHEAVKN